MRNPTWQLTIDHGPPIGFEDLDHLAGWLVAQLHRPPPRPIFETLPEGGRFAVRLDANGCVGKWGWVERLCRDVGEPTTDQRPCQLFCVLQPGHAGPCTNVAPADSLVAFDGRSAHCEPVMGAIR